MCAKVRLSGAHSSNEGCEQAKPKYQENRPKYEADDS
jgi:hypothetical protein